MNWDDPQMVSLYERIAAAVQREYEDSSLDSGGVANPDHLGARAASEILRAATTMEFGATAWRLGFTPDRFPYRTSDRYGCATCSAGEGELHQDYCKRFGRVMRAPDAQVVL